MNLKQRLGKRIQELRLKNNMLQSELAEKAGIAAKHQSCIETGKNFPSAELIEKYAKIFELDVSQILAISHIKPKEELVLKIDKIIKKADEEKIKTIYKILNDIIN